jgi:hypothetical protein
VKGDRSPVEYCWTATPPIVLHMLENGGGELVSYIDADTLCFGDPQPLFAEMNGASVLLIPDVGLPNDELGKFLAGLISFRNDERGREAAGWWRERCLAWCYDRIEPGLYGAVRHLDDWPERFSFVRVARHPGATAGPWNIGGLGLAQRGSRLLVRGEPLIFYHCVARWLYRGRLTALPRRGFLSSYYHRTAGPEPLVWAAAFPTPEREHILVEAPYMERIAEAMRELRRLDANFEAGTVPLTARELGYSVLRWALPRSVRHGLKQAFLSRAPKRRGPPGGAL